MHAQSLMSIMPNQQHATTSVHQLRCSLLARSATVEPLRRIDRDARKAVSVSDNLPALSLTELANMAGRVATMREAAFENSPVGMWIVHADGSCRLNAAARNIAGTPDSLIDFGQVGWESWYRNGEVYEAVDWPVSQAFDGKTTEHSKMVVRGQFRAAYAVKVKNCKPVLQAGKVIGCTLEVYEETMPIIADPPWGVSDESGHRG